jgi:peptide/nickel transport system permease protein
VTAAAVPSDPPARQHLLRRALAATRRRPSIAFAVVVISFWVLVLLTVQWWAPYDPYTEAGPRLQPPSTTFWFGTDELGRDLFTRVMYGARESLPISFAVIAVAVAIGTVLGAMAGYFGGWVDAVIMRLSDVLMAFPALLLAMVVSVGLGPGPRNAAIAVVIVWWPGYARLVRGQVLSIRSREHVEAAVTIGAGRRRVIGRHVLPLAITPIMVNATSDLGQVVIVMSSLSFLGLGTAPPVPEWGALITSGAKFFFQWWIAAAPGLAILTVVVGFNFLGDGLRDLLDRRSAAR